MERIRTALITGASGGIGEEFARHLAARGCTPVLVARRTERLRELADELRATTTVEPEIRTADLSTDAGVAATEERLTDPAQPVDLLVNNAGIGDSGPVADADGEQQDRQLYLNTAVPLRLTRVAARQMKQRRHGAVVNVASLAGALPGAPNSAVYSASKAFIRSLGEGLQAELRPFGVRVVTVNPGYVPTPMTEGLQEQNPPGVVWVSARKVVAESLRALTTGRSSVVPGAQYKFADTLMRVLPRTLLRAGVNRAMGGGVLRDGDLPSIRQR